MKHRLLSLLAALFAVITASASHSAESYIIQVDGIYYELTGDDTVEVTYEEMWADTGCYSGDVVIPATVIYDGKSYAVTSISEYAFSGCTGLTSIKLPEGLTSIGYCAFSGCTGLTSIKLPEGLTSIGYCAFSGCTGLTSIKLPEGLTSIENSAFSECTGLTSINIPEGVILIGESVFSGCSSLTSITLPEGITSIGYGAFSDCSSLTSVTIPKTVISIGEYAFSGSGLTSVTLPESLTTIGRAAFMGCGLTSITIPTGVTSIDRITFEGCRSLISVTLCEGVTSIGEEAFFDCSSLTSITIPNSLTSTGYYAFKECDNLKEVHISDISAWCKINFDYIGNPLYYAHNLYLNGNLVEELIIPEGVTSISHTVFEKCQSLTSVTLPESLTFIGYSAFNGCSNLREVHISDLSAWCGIEFQSNPSSYSHNLYLNGSLIEDLIIPEGVTSISANAFSGNFSITSIFIPESVTSIGEKAFYECWNVNDLTINCLDCEISSKAFYSVPVSTLNTNYDFLANCNLEGEYGGFIFNPQNITIDGVSIKSFDIPDKFESFKNLAIISGCSDIKSINTGNGLKTIPSVNLRNINSITLGRSMTSLGGAQFPNAVAVFAHTPTPPTITNATFPKCEFGESGVVIVDSPAMQKTYSEAPVWEDMQISNLDNYAEVYVDEPGDLSFEMIVQTGVAVAKVVTLKIHGPVNAEDFRQMRVNMSALMNIDLSDAEITSIPSDALKGKVTLSSIILPSSCTSIGKNAFADCSNLQNVVLGDECQTIDAYAFYNCSSLSEISLPESLREIGGSAFMGTGLSNIEFNEGLVTIGDYAFQSCKLSEVTFPDTVETIGYATFSFCNVSKVTFGSGLKTIGDYAFYGCNISQELALPSALTYIGEMAFANQPGIVGQLAIGDNVNYLGDGAFQGTSISSVSLPESLYGVSTSAFKGCEKLQSVYLPDNITFVGESAFEGCVVLSDIVLPDALEDLGAYSFHATDIRSMVVPQPVTVINEATFAECQSLHSMVLPSGLTRINSNAFYGCKALRNLSVSAVVPPTIADATVFRGVNTDLCVISIPTASYRDYVLADYWGQFIQMRNDIAVEEEGNGETTFDSGDEVEEEPGEENTGAEEAKAKKSANRRAQAINTVENGTTLYIPKDGIVRFYFNPAEGEHIISVELDGVDVTDKLVNNSLTVVADKRKGSLKVVYSNDHVGVELIAPDSNDSDAPAVYYNLQGVRAQHPDKGFYIKKQGTKVEKVIF